MLPATQTVRLPVNLLMKMQANVSVHSQEDPFDTHPSSYNEPSTKTETGRISEIDHRLGKGEGEAIDVCHFL